MSRGAPCEYLVWDSEFFAIRVGRVTAPLDPDTMLDVRSWCATHAIDCLYFLAGCSDRTAIATAEANGFRLVDVRMNLVRHPAQPAAAEHLPASDSVRPACADDLETLRAIARVSHHDSRFYQDARFPRDRCDALYETWIEKSGDGYADAVLVAAEETRAVGYITCKVLPEGVGRVGLFAVGPGDQGRGFGRALVQRSLHWFAGGGVTRVMVATQGGNVPALHVYERCGFFTESVQLWYHWWKASS